MKKSHKILFGVAAFVIFLIIGVIALNSYLKSEVVKGLDKEFPASGLEYSEISLNILGGNTTLTDPVLKIKGITIEAGNIKLKGFSYYNYFFKDEININHIQLISPNITIDQSDTLEKNEEKDPVERTIKLQKFSTVGGSLKMVDNDTASNSLFLSLKEIVFLDILLGKEIDGDLLPFQYKTLEVDVDSVYYNMNAEHYITVDAFKYLEDELSIQQFNITPKFPKPEFDRQLPYEKDWVALEVDEVVLQDFSWSTERDSLILKSSTTTISRANAEIYRNKLLPDDKRIKPLYSELIRELGIKVEFDSIGINDSRLIYQEKVDEERPSGELTFSNIKAKIENLTNLNMSREDFPETKISATALFMDQSQLTLNLNFDVKNKLDEFHVFGNLAEISADGINSFLIPAMNIEAEGRIESMAYNFYGNRNEAKGDMQLAYRGFKVNILKDGEQQRKSLLSRLANLIIKNDVADEDVEQEEINTTRDKTKSFWNFLWLCIRDGALKTFF